VLAYLHGALGIAPGMGMPPVLRPECVLRRPAMPAIGERLQ
jgi:hypothetical protein